MDPTYSFLDAYANETKTEGSSLSLANSAYTYISKYESVMALGDAAFAIFSPDTITRDELVSFCSKKGVSTDNFHVIVYCFDTNGWNHSFFAGSTSNAEQEFKRTLRDLDIPTLLCSQLWDKVTQKDDNTDTDSYDSVIEGLGGINHEIFDRFTENMMTMEQLIEISSENDVSYTQFRSIINCFTTNHWTDTFFAEPTPKDRASFESILAAQNISTDTITALWRQCVANMNNFEDYYPDTDFYDSVFEMFGGRNKPTFDIFTSDTITVDELIYFGLTNDVTKNDFREIISCFNYPDYNWDSSFFIDATPDTKADFERILSENLGHSPLWITALWRKCIHEPEPETDLDLSFLGIYSSPPIAQANVGISVTWPIGSFRDIAWHLKNNLWNKHRNFYRIAYANVYNVISFIDFYCMDWGRTIDEQKRIDEYDSKGKGWVKYCAIWMGKRVDVHIHVNVVSRQTRVNIELFPSVNCPSWEYRREDRLSEIGRDETIQGSTNKYVCSEWVIKYLKNLKNI